MSRPEFRLWDVDEERMYIPYNHHIKMNLGGRISIDGGWTNNYIERMLYTDFISKNGKQICEGDIITTEFDCGPYVVKFGIIDIEDDESYERHTICGFYLEGGGTREHMDDMRKSKVIGNIYENPELLE